ncbi:TetR/AcrR family transcriptional regulator [Microbacterium gorillae]|uniref:TetR/AcrR family transcriptional regulator n=1 Tax=Microbacterium gorillae TaxID=1231063 RepID=UPI00069382B2|nr:TetR/AcrR family transcriptional regulator [Microbacterium gorillae]
MATPSSPEVPATALPGRAREARENDVALLRAAREVFAAEGYDAPMSAVAARAGIGVGGIYRRYANKEELVQRVRGYALEELTATANEVAASAAGPDGALAAFLRRHLTIAGAMVTSALSARSDFTAELAALSDGLRDALEHLLVPDRARGLVPEDFGPGDVMAAIVHLRAPVSANHHRDRIMHQRQLEFFLRGLRAAVTDPVTEGAATSWDDWMALHIRPEA